MRNKRALLISTTVILLCVTVIAGVTWALFTDTRTVVNHMEAGDLTITLTRTELTKTTLDSDGLLATTVVQKPTDEEVDFTEPSDENIFGLTEGERLVPGSKFVATMKVQNQSDVAFNYWIRIVCKGEDAAKALAQQTAITIYRDLNGDGEIDLETEAVTVDRTISSGVEDGNEQNFVGLITKGESDRFVIAVEFLDKGFHFEDGVLSSENNAAQTQDVEFDLIVYAVQATKAPAAETKTAAEP